MVSGWWQQETLLDPEEGFQKGEESLSDYKLYSLRREKIFEGYKMDNKESADAYLKLEQLWQMCTL